MSDAVVDREVIEMMKAILPELIRLHGPRIYANGGVVSRDLLNAAHQAACAAVALCRSNVVPDCAMFNCPHKAMVSDFCHLHQG